MNGRRGRTIIFITQTHTQWGGIELWIDEFARWMRGHGWDVVAGMAQGRCHNDPELFRAAHPELTAFVMDGRAGTDSARVRAVMGAIRRSGAGVVIMNGIAATYPAVRQLKLAGADLRLIVPVFSLHPGVLSNAISEHDVVDAVVANNRIAEAVLCGELGAEGRVHHVVQGPRPATAVRHRTGGPLRVGYVGRFEDLTKRVRDLPRLLDSVDFPLRVDLYGDGPDRDAVVQVLQGRARWHGYKSKDDLYRDVYPDLDVLLLFSPAEGSPNVIYEAMQHGVVPVTSRFRGHAAEGVVRHGENAMTFPVGDMQKASEILRLLSNDRRLLEELGLRARATVQQLTDARMHAGWQEVIERAVAAPMNRARRRDPIRPAGRLDRMIGSAAADLVRRHARRSSKPTDGWAEWPGSLPVAPERWAAIERASESIEAAAVASIYE